MSTPAGRPFDPRGVPARPVVDVRFDTDDEGREVAVVDGLPIRRESHETARESAIRTVAGLVDRIASIDESGRRSLAVRARVHAPRGASHMLVVHRERRVFVPADGPLRPAVENAAAAPHGGAASTHGGAAAPATAPAASAAAASRNGSRAPAPIAAESNRWPGTAAVSVTDPPRKRRPSAWSPPSSPSSPSPSSRPAPTAPAARMLTHTIDAPAPPETRPIASPGLTVGPDARPVPVASAPTRTPTVGAATGGSDRPPPASQGASLAAPSRAPDEAVSALLRTARSTGRRGSQSVPGLPPHPRRRPPAASRSARASTPRSASPSGHGGRHLGPRRLRPTSSAVVAAALVVLVCASSLVWSFARPYSPAVNPADAAARVSAAPALPVEPPAGWQRNARWATPPLLPAAGAAVVVDDAIAYVTSDRRLTVVDGMTGRPRWSAELPAGKVRRAPARTTLHGVDALALHVGDALLSWRVTDGASRPVVALPRGAAVTFLGAAPLVGLRADTVGVVRDGRVAEVAVPGGATPLAASPAGTVTAAATAGWWHLRPDVPAPLPAPWESADAGPSPRPRVVGYLDGSIVTVDPADRRGRAQVVVHTDRGADVRMSFRGALAPGAAAPLWSPSPSRTWGVLGRAIVDVRAGSVTDLGAWSTTWVADDRAYGTIAGAPVVAGPEVPRGSLPRGAPPVEAMSRQGGAVRIAESEGQRVYFLPPRQ